MEVVRDIKSFVKKNKEQLVKFFIYKTGIKDKDIIDEHIQDFYLKLIQTRALEKYHVEKGAFDTYITTSLCWLMPIKAKKNINNKYQFISEVPNYSKENFDLEDVWEQVNIINGGYRVDFSPCTPRIFDYTEEEDLEYLLEDFKKYISRTESKHVAEQLITFIEEKQNGCNSTDIARILDVSNTMVKFIKQKLQRKFEIWKKRI